MSYTNKHGITIHDESEFAAMRASGNLAAQVLDMVADNIDVGITTNEINDLCHQMTIKAGAKSAPLNYKGFPKSICTSVNNVVCHGIPNDKKLKNGDIINVDVTVLLDGWHGDTSRMFLIGNKVPLKAQKLVQNTYDSMMKGIEQVRPGATLGDIGHAISAHVKPFNYGVVTEFCGHGIGQVFHAMPNVVNFGEKGQGMILEEGMFFTVEPMINIGKAETKLNEKDGWTVTTKDRSLSAQFEHTLGVTKDGFEIFTLSPKGLHHPP